MADEDTEARDPLYPVAVEIVQRTGRPSISLVQRQLRIGYNRAAELIERMEQEGLVTPMGEDGNRELVQSVFPSRPAPEAPKPQEEPGYPSNAWFGWLLALAVIGCLVAGWIDIDNLMWWLLGAALPAGAVVLGLITRCPRCGSWWAAQEVSSRVVDRYQKNKEVDRVDVTRDAAGNEIARTERRETVTVNVEKRRESHQCNRCDFTWTEDIEYGR